MLQQLPLLTLGHGAMTFPPPRDPTFSYLWFSQGCSIGCDCDGNTDYYFSPTDLCGGGWKPTLPDAYRTFANISMPSGQGDFTEYHPWRSPGTARPLDSCGLAGGSTKNNDAAGGFGNMTIAHKQGFNGSALPPVATPAKWQAGATVEVSWTIWANHGGGYVYRLCPAAEGLTEACFERTILPFVGATQRLRWRSGKELEIPATRVAEGTYPKGSVWSKVPIPACKSFSGGFKGKGCDTPTFAPPKGCDETCWGYEQCFLTLPSGKCNYPLVKTIEIPAIVDKVMLPKSLKPGKYVVSLRWDCEQTPQIWNQCGDVEIAAAHEEVEVEVA